MTRSPEATGLLWDLGAEPVVADGLDEAAVMRTVGSAEPEVVIHEMTGLTGVKSVKKFDDEFALTNRLRTEGLDNLLAAARAVGARRFIAQSFGNWNYERAGSSVKTEDDPLDPSPPARMSRTLAAIRYLESTLAANDDIEGIALRYANFYGPGSAQFAEDGTFVDQVRKRRLPIVGDGAGVWSFIHYDDAATATMLGNGSRRTRCLQHRRRRARPGVGLASGARGSVGGQTAPARAGLARTTGRRRARRLLVHPDPRCFQREGQPGAGLAADVPELA
jgi:nucleoside-diphosphate-sugar epimerase